MKVAPKNIKFICCNFIKWQVLFCMILLFQMSQNMAKNISNHELQIIINLYMSHLLLLTFKSIHNNINVKKNYITTSTAKSEKEWGYKSRIKIESSSSVQIECNLVCKIRIFHNDEMEKVYEFNFHLTNRNRMHLYIEQWKDSYNCEFTPYFFIIAKYAIRLKYIAKGIAIVFTTQHCSNSYIRSTSRCV